MNSTLLRSIMVLHEDTNQTLADYLGITSGSLRNKLKEEGTEFKQREIKLIKDRYHLSMEQVEAIFFCDHPA